MGAASGHEAASVARKLDRVTVSGPGDDPAAQVQCPLKTLLHQVGAGLVRAGAAAAVDH